MHRKLILYGEYYLRHGVYAIFRLHFGHADNISAVSDEFSTEEKINEIYLTNNVDKIENFADEESESIEVVVVQVGSKVVD